jgi:hypothetical protein
MQSFSVVSVPLRFLFLSASSFKVTVLDEEAMIAKKRSGLQ